MHFKYNLIYDKYWRFRNFGNSANVDILENLSLFQVKYNDQLGEKNNINHLNAKYFSQQCYRKLKKVNSKIRLVSPRNKPLKMSSKNMCFWFFCCF